MRVFVFGTRGFPDIQGGVEAHCERLYTSMPKEEVEITVFRRKPYVVHSELKYKSVRFIDLPSTRIKGLEAFIHSLLSTICCLVLHPDIVHIHNIGPGLFTPILRVFGVNVVLTYHSSNYEHAKWGFIAKKILKLGEYCSLKFANYIIFVNKSKQNLFSTWIQQKSIYIPNGIQRVEPTTQTNLLKQIGLQPYAYFLSVGRITQEKGFDYLIDAYRMCNCSVPLVIAGGIDHTSDYASRLEKDTLHDPNIYLLGYTYGELLRQLYTFAKTFILPSYSEGFPIVLMEAVNYHKPILASNIEANREVGLPEFCYFHVGDVEDLAVRLKEEAEKDYVGIDYHKSFLDWSEISRKVLLIYKQVLK